MAWVLVFAAILIVWLVVTAVLVLGLYRKLRALLGSVARLGRRLDAGVQALNQISANRIGAMPTSPPEPGA